MTTFQGQCDSVTLGLGDILTSAICILGKANKQRPTQATDADRLPSLLLCEIRQIKEIRMPVVVSQLKQWISESPTLAVCFWQSLRCPECHLYTVVPGYIEANVNKTLDWVYIMEDPQTAG